MLEGNPKSTQTLYRFACRGSFPTMYMTKKGKDLKEQYQWEMTASKIKCTNKPVELTIDLYFNDKRKRDVDNFNKLILDAGNGILWDDDNQIQSLTVNKHYDKDTPRIEIKYKELLTQL